MAFAKLLGLCLAMFSGAYLCGEIPLRCPISQKRMRYLTTLGVGLLIGVSFIVIIPEGVHTYYGAKQPASTHQHQHTLSIKTNATAHAMTATTTTTTPTTQQHQPSQLSRDIKSTASATDGVGEAPKMIPAHPSQATTLVAVTPTTTTTTTKDTHAAEEHTTTTSSTHEGEDGEEEEHDDHDHEHEHTEGESEGEHTHSHQECVDIGTRSSASVGLALVAGFVVMFLVDRLGGAEEGHAHGHGGGDTPQHNHQHSHLGGDEIHTDTTLIHVHPTHPIPSAVGSSSSLSSSSGGNHEHSRSMCDSTSSPSPPPSSQQQQNASSSAEPPNSMSTLSSSESNQNMSSLRVNTNSTTLTPRLNGGNSSSTHDSSSSDQQQQQKSHSHHLSQSQSQPSPQPHFDQTATIGILVHSAIDGLALGAISVSDNSSLELVVFFAIILHKAPAAFGLTSFLLHQGRSAGEVRKHLLYFSLAAPLTSLATYLCFGYYNQLAGSNSLSASSPDGQALLGLCLLFSAGTFLFTIAVHILPEIQQQKVGSNGEQKPAEWTMVTCLIAGILAPLTLSGHSHGH